MKPQEGLRYLSDILRLNFHSLLSTMSDLELDNVSILRGLAFKMEEMNNTEASIALFGRILEIKGEEPQVKSWLFVLYSISLQVS